jgi:hypothetical protein
MTENFDLLDNKALEVQVRVRPPNFQNFAYINYNSNCKLKPMQLLLSTDSVECNQIGLTAAGKQLVKRKKVLGSAMYRFENTVSEEEKVFNDRTIFHVKEIFNRISLIDAGHSSRILRRVSALRTLQSHSDAIGVQYKEERIRLEKKYHMMLQPYLVRGMELISGEVEVSETSNTGNKNHNAELLLETLLSFPHFINYAMRIRTRS